MDPSIWWSVALIMGLLCMSAFFSGSETALTAVDKSAMHRRSAQGSRGANTALNLMEDNERLIGAILLGKSRKMSFPSLVNDVPGASASHSIWEVGLDC